MRTQWWLLTLLVASLCASAGFAGEVDRRFDGRWVGTEVFQYSSAALGGFGGGSRLMTFETVLGIKDHGKTVGITKGYATGRYEVVPEKSGGNTLEFQMPNTSDNVHFMGRQHCTLTLSADGSTIKESGIGIMATGKGGRGLNGVVWATYHRQGSY